METTCPNCDKETHLSEVSLDDEKTLFFECEECGSDFDVEENEDGIQLHKINY